MKKYAILTNLGYLQRIPKTNHYFCFTDDIEDAGTYSLNVARSALKKFQYPNVSPSDMSWKQIKKVKKLEIIEVEIIYNTKQVHEEDFKLQVAEPRDK